MRAVLRLMCVVSLLTGVPDIVFAQGAIGGVVRDTSGGVLPGVTVEAASPALIERVRTAVTDGNGQYLIVDLRPGVYTVTLTLTGFTALKREGLQLSAGVTLPVNGELKVGTVQETVTVTGATPVVDVKNTRQQAVVTREVLDAIPRTRNQQLTGALLPGVIVAGQVDVGGSSGEPVTNLSIHGGDPNDQILAVDGMKITEGGAGARRAFIVADNTAQEYTYALSAISAEVPTGGVQLNLVPREGGNTFKGTVYADFTTKGLTSDNLSDELKRRGLASTTRVDRVWDVSPAIGGPVQHDRLWFFITYRNWGANNFPANAFYLSDPTRPAKHESHFWSANARLTWQATQRNKFSLFHDKQARYIPYLSVSNLIPPETATGEADKQMHLTQAKWSSPVTNRVLLEAAGYHFYQVQPLNMSPASRLTRWEFEPADRDAWPTLEVSTGKWTAGSRITATFFPGTTRASWWGESGSLSYITGSHAFKVGGTHVAGTYFASYPPVPPILRLLNGQPFQIQLLAKPGEARPRVNHDLGVYAQDQWALGHLTLNLGLRFDYFNGQVDAQHAPAGRWYLPERVLPKIPNVPDWKDVSPRLGVAYDVFGNGKTAFKTSLSRYVASEATNFQGSVNPLGSPFVPGLTDTRTWSDRNGDRLPQDDEVGPSTNLAFGLPILTTVPDERLRAGWGKRVNNWEFALSAQQEVLPGVSVSASYFRRSYGNLTWTDNRLVELTDYTPFTIVSPLDGESITLYNLNPAKRGLSDNLITFAPGNSKVFNGVDLLINGRFGRGSLLSGGISMGRTVTDNCTADDPNARRFCHVAPPFMAGNQYKFMAAHPLPFGVQISGTFVSISGPLVSGNYTLSSALAGVPLTLGSLSVNLVEPGTLYAGRSNRVDLRFGKSVRRRQQRFQPYVDLLNMFNASPVIALNNTFGTAWQQPQTILVGRMIKFGMQVDF